MVLKFSCTEGCENYKNLDWSMVVKKMNTRQNYLKDMMVKNQEEQTITMNANTQFTGDILTIAVRGLKYL